MNPRWLALPLALLALLTSGCGDEVQAQFGDRTELPSCGSLDVDPVQRWRAAGREAWDCFARALESGEPAEIAVTYPTDEGDPIRAWFRLTGDEMEIYEDATDDPFGSGEWMFSTCAPPEELGRTIGCG